MNCTSSIALDERLLSERSECHTNDLLSKRCHGFSCASLDCGDSFSCQCDSASVCRHESAVGDTPGVEEHQPERQHSVTEDRSTNSYGARSVVLFTVGGCRTTVSKCFADARRLNLLTLASILHDPIIFFESPHQAVLFRSTKK